MLSAFSHLPTQVIFLFPFFVFLFLLISYSVLAQYTACLTPLCLKHDTYNAIDNHCIIQYMPINAICILTRRRCDYRWKSARTERRQGFWSATTEISQY
jgi:hypothetical protein